MTLFIDDSLMTDLITRPITEGWVDRGDVDVVVEANIALNRIGPADVALLPGPLVAGLARTHFVDPSVAVITDAMSTIQMRTPVRPDGVEETPIRLLDCGPTAEVLMRALLRPYFGITASRFITSDDDPAAADAQVVVVDGLLGLETPDFGHYEDLAKDWYVLTGAGIVHEATAIGVEAEARGDGSELALLQAAVAAGVERRRDVRRLILEDAGEEVDRDALVRLTNGIRFELTDADRQSLRNLLARGTWGTTYARNLPAFREELTA